MRTFSELAMNCHTQERVIRESHQKTCTAPFCGGARAGMLCFQPALFPSPFRWSGRLLKFPPVPSLVVLLIPALSGDVVFFLLFFFFKIYIFKVNIFFRVSWKPAGLCTSYFFLSFFFYFFPSFTNINPSFYPLSFLPSSLYPAFYEQLTKRISNFLAFQCWTASVFVSGLCTCCDKQSSLHSSTERVAIFFLPLL